MPITSACRGLYHLIPQAPALKYWVGTKKPYTIARYPFHSPHPLFAPTQEALNPVPAVEVMYSSLREGADPALEFSTAAYRRLPSDPTIPAILEPLIIVLCFLMEMSHVQSDIDFTALELP